jgi:hypothetical protein
MQSRTIFLLTTSDDVNRLLKDRHSSLPRAGCTDARASPVTHADRHDGGIIITFEDGKTAFYPAALLHSVFAQAEEFLEVEDKRLA